MARIAIDVDGVLANFTKAFTEVVNKLWPGRAPKDYEPPDWDYGGLLTKAEMSKAWRVIRGMENFWLSLDAYPESVGALAQWMVSQTDHDIWLCTSRAEVAGMTAAKQTEIWLQSTGVRAVNNFIGIITVPDSVKKAVIYEAMEIAWSLDDKGETVIDCGLIDTFKHNAFVLDRPWNQSFSIYNRVVSVDEFLRRIK